MQVITIFTTNYYLLAALCMVIALAAVTTYLAVRARAVKRAAPQNVE